MQAGPSWLMVAPVHANSSMEDFKLNYRQRKAQGRADVDNRLKTSQLRLPKRNLLSEY
jgi:hypothetical protein